MPHVRYHVPVDDAELTAGLERIRREFDVPEAHSQAARDEADATAHRGPRLPPDANKTWTNADDLPFIAIDPPGARDLDQAYTAERRGDGYRIHYAIADVAAFVTPGGAVESEALERGVTMYAPDGRASLHPDVLNEGAASLLPGERRPSILWTMDLDADGELVQATAARAFVRVRESMTYLRAQEEIDNDARLELQLLEEIGIRRLRIEQQRGAVSLALPSQEISRDEHGHVQLSYDHPLPVEHWNAQISLLTGIAAAEIMLKGAIGLLRTLPPPDPATVNELRRTARHLGIAWSDDQTYADRVRTLDPNRPREAALLMRSARGLRGAGYVAFSSRDEVPEDPQHSAIASTYAHVTAPLRRVCDRYTNEIVLSLCAGEKPPDWATARLPDIPSIMGRTRQRERALENAIIDFVETVMLAPNVGGEFDAVVVNHRRESAIIQLRDPAVVAALMPKRPLGEELRVRLLGIDRESRTSVFEIA